VGWKANKLVLGKLSGRAAFKARLEELGIALGSQVALDLAFARFKELADKKHEIFDEDLQALVSDVAPQESAAKYQLSYLEAHSKTGVKPTAKVTLEVDGQLTEVEAEGDGPVDAAFKAVEKIVNSGSALLLYSVNAITTGTDSQGEVTVRLECNGTIVNGSGADTDIVVASVKAYLHALNLLSSGVVRAHPQKEGV
jgi:2-isopropylmalate synthase